VACTSFAFPLRILQRIIYCYLTGRKRHFSNEELLDGIFAMASLTWLIEVAQFYLHERSLGDIPGLKNTYIGHVALELKSDDSFFKLNFLLSVVAASFWFKVFFML
jgi:hypothetical protein